MSPSPWRGGRGAGGPGGRSALVRPPALPGRATKQASLATLRSWWARPPYCSGLLVRATPGRGPCVLLVRWFAGLSRPPREQAGGARGRAVCGSSCVPPPGVAVPSGGGGTPPLPRRGWRTGASASRRPGGGSGGERGGGPRRCSPSPCPGGVAPGPSPCPPASPAPPPLVYTFSRGCWAAVGGGQGLVRCRWVNVAWGGEVSLPLSAPPPSPGRHQGEPLRLSSPGCCCSVAAHGASAEPPVGNKQCGSEWAVNWGRLTRGCASCGCGIPTLGARALSGGCGAASLGGGEGRPGGGVPRSPPPGSLAPPPDGRGGAAWCFRSRGASR